MTAPEQRRQEFTDNCVNEDRGDRPNAVRIDGVADQKREDERFQNRAEYHQKAAYDNLNGDALSWRSVKATT